ncbi:ABC transporter permease [Luteipulveratus mongoliensis]|uniref:ABC transporter permease n=1 Tax=Luteipulveratus mongoliensis TaxID=571913 RepID=A0A0K1JPE9_9MICO|nr:ABC transporter permease [Luteipulveratus mongoliensis]AKU18440.1 ABC transporter permease [Luteipulveratus mongoliensis]
MSTTQQDSTATTAATTSTRGPVTGAWRIVASREIAVKLRDRNFLISTGVTLFAIIASMLVSGWLGSRGSTVDIAIAGQGSTQVLQGAQRAADAQDSDVTLKPHVVADQQAVEQQVRDGKADVGLVPTSGGWRLVGDTDKDTDVAAYVQTSAAQIAVQRNAAAAGTTVEELQRGSSVTYDLLQPNATDEATAKVSGFVFAFLFYLSSILFGMAIAQSVVEEKQNRIVEILASAIPLRQLLVGKVVGSTTLAFSQLALFVGAGLAGMSAMGRGDDIAAVAGAAGWFVVFFVVGFLALAALWAVAGSLATRSEDLQSTSTPLSMLLMIVLFAGIFASGTAQVIASYVPIVSIVAMPGRVVAGTASWWEPLVSLALMAAVAYGVVVIAERIYRRSLMQTQKRLTMRQALHVED